MVLGCLTASAQTDTIRVEQWRARGYHGFFEAGVVAGTDGISTGMITTTHGYQFCPYFFLGAGVGVESHDCWNVKDCLVAPVFADFKYYILKSRLVPYVDLKAGYAFGSDCGLYLNPSIGIDYTCKRNIGVYLNAGYVARTFHNIRNDWFPDEYKSGFHSGITFTLGIRF